MREERRVSRVGGKRYVCSFVYSVAKLLELYIYVC